MNKPWTKTYGPGVPLEIDADAHPSIVALFEQAVTEYADKPAFECFGRTMTYAEVDRASRAVAAASARFSSLKLVGVVWLPEVVPWSGVMAVSHSISFTRVMGTHSSSAMSWVCAVKTP